MHTNEETELQLRYPKPNRENIAMYLVERQMSIIGKTFEDAENDKDWFHNYTMTQEQFLEFKKEALYLIKKVFKCNKAYAEKNFDWWNLNWGLRIFPIPEDVRLLIANLPFDARKEKKSNK